MEPKDFVLNTFDGSIFSSLQMDTQLFCMIPEKTQNKTLLLLKTV